MTGSAEGQVRLIAERLLSTGTNGGFSDILELELAAGMDKVRFEVVPTLDSIRRGIEFSRDRPE